MLCEQCLKCSILASYNHRAIFCDVCQSLAHSRCTVLNNNDYKLLANYGSGLYCSRCMSDMFPFNHIDDGFELKSSILITSVTFMCLLDLRQMISSNVHNVIDNDSKYYIPIEVKVAIDKLNICFEFSVLHNNIRSLLSKLDHLQALLEVTNVKFDVIVVSETWETDLNDQLLHINEYKKSLISGVMVE